MDATDPAAPVTVRRATAEDAPGLAGLRYAFRSSVGSATEDRDAFVARCEAWMRPRLAGDSAWRCWVAERDGAIMGHLWLQLIEKIPNPVVELELHGYVTNVFVLPEARAGGLGEQLVATAMAYCREAGVDSVVLWPTQRSRSLYARHGFAVRDDIMEAVLDDGRHIGHTNATPST